MTFSVTLTLPPPPITVIGGGQVENLLETVISLTSKKRRVITNASAILNDESKITSSRPNQHPRATGIAFEEQMLVKFSNKSLAEEVRASLRLGTLDTDLQIDFDKSSFPTSSNYYNGNVIPPSANIVFRGNKYRGWLVNLPCLIESHISSNKKQFYKVADISQMLVIGNEEDVIPPVREWPHGLTPPLSFVRQRRFRKQAAKESLIEVSSTVRRLLEADKKSLSIELELIDTIGLDHQEDEELDEEEEEISSIASGPIVTNGISDDEISELAAEINYDEDLEEDQSEKMEEESVDEDSIPSNILSAGNHFSLLQSRIYSRLSSASNANPEEIDGLNRVNRFSDALKFLSQRGNDSIDPTISPPVLDDYEVYRDKDEDILSNEVDSEYSNPIIGHFQNATHNMDYDHHITNNNEISENEDIPTFMDDSTKPLDHDEYQDLNREDLLDVYSSWLNNGSFKPQE